MSRPVSEIPYLPISGRAYDIAGLNAFDQDLAKALFNNLTDLARRANATLPKDGQEPMTGPLTITVSGDGANLLIFDIEREWVFRQRGTGASTALSLEAMVAGKDFQIRDSAGNIIVSFGDASGAGTEFGTLVGLNAGQLQFPSTQAPSTNVNTLDDYEEGSWTPTLTFGVPGDLSVVYDIRAGSYIKIGKLVTLTGRLRTTTFTHTTASGNLRITGVPFTAATISGMEWISAVDYQGITHSAGRTGMIANLASGAAIIQFVGSGSGVTRDAIDAPNTTSGTQITLAFTFTYEASA